MIVTGVEQPTLLRGTHDLQTFDSGEAVLDDWLRKRALGNGEIGASRTYVVCENGTPRVVGFQALSMGQILAREVPGAMRRNMPRHIPAVVLGRLAIDRRWQGKGLGRLLLADVIRRSQIAAAEGFGTLDPGARDLAGGRSVLSASRFHEASRRWSCACARPREAGGSPTQDVRKTRAPRQANREAP